MPGNAVSGCSHPRATPRTVKQDVQYSSNQHWPVTGTKVFNTRETLLVELGTHTMGTTFGAAVAMLVDASEFSAQNGQVGARYAQVVTYIT